MINNLIHKLGKKFTCEKSLSIKDKLNLYVKSIFPTFDLIMSTQSQLGGQPCDNGFWIDLNPNIKCLHQHIPSISSNTENFYFTYFGNIILMISINPKCLSVYLPTDLKSKNNIIFSKFQDDNNIIITTTNYDLNIIYKVFVKCFDLLYKKVIVKNEIKIQEELIANQIKLKQTQLRINKQMEHVTQFANNYKLLDIK